MSTKLEFFIMIILNKIFFCLIFFSTILGCKAQKVTCNNDYEFIISRVINHFFENDGQNYFYNSKSDFFKSNAKIIINENICNINNYEIIFNKKSNITNDIIVKRYKKYEDNGKYEYSIELYIPSFTMTYKYTTYGEGFNVLKFW